MTPRLMECNEHKSLAEFTLDNLTKLSRVQFAQMIYVHFVP